METDARILLLARVLRLLAFGYSAVVLAVYFAELGIEPAAIGLIFAAALGGSGLSTLAITNLADRVGRRRMLALSAWLMAISGLGFAFGLAGQVWLLSNASRTSSG